MKKQKDKEKGIEVKSEKSKNSNDSSISEDICED